VAAARVPSSAWFLDLVFPPRCVACQGPASGLCASCLGALRPLTPPRCARCGAPTAWPVERCRECAGRRLAFARATSAFAYEGPATAFVRAWKERGLRRLAPLAARLVADRVACPAADVITYIPPDLVRQLERSRHPAPALAEELAANWRLPCRPLLRRTRSTGRQASLPLAQRGRNVRDLFAAEGRPPRRVALVDDVYTSGSTVNAAARALLRGGARHVEVVTFARAIR
jgi:predicted amidophosphoribosyltransferase